jgi:hypothetical protein
MKHLDKDAAEAEQMTWPKVGSYLAPINSSVPFIMG